VSIAELERMWAESPGEAPSLLPSSAWERLASGDAVGAVMMREEAEGELSLVVALPSMLVHAIDHPAEPTISAGPGGGLEVNLAFGPGMEWSVELTSHDMCVPSTAGKLARQDSMPVAWIDVDEQVVIARTRRTLDDARLTLLDLADPEA
jgi:hypothetical protein